VDVNVTVATRVVLRLLVVFGDEPAARMHTIVLKPAKEAME
jgi:hypothetical protein